MKKYVKLAVFFVILVFSGCNRQENIISDFEKYFEEYSENVVPALFFCDDEETILSAIAFIEEFIAKGGSNKNALAYFDKARLFFRLNRDDEALEALNALYMRNNILFYMYRSSLLIMLGRDDEAAPYLQKLIDISKGGLNELEEDEFFYRNSAIKALVLLYVLADRSHESIESILNKLITEGAITQQDAEILLQEYFFQFYDIEQVKEEFLISMWFR